MKSVILFTLLILANILFGQCPSEILPSNDTLCNYTYTIEVASDASVNMFSTNTQRIEVRESENGGPWSAWGSNVDIPDGSIGFIEVRSTPNSDGEGADLLIGQNDVPNCPDANFIRHYTVTNSDEGSCSTLPIQFLNKPSAKIINSHIVLEWNIAQDVNRKVKTRNFSQSVFTTLAG